MKFCTKCGAQLEDDIKYCSFCGNPVGNENVQNYSGNNGETKNTLKKIAFIFMIIATCIVSFVILPLAWCLPMTLSLNNKIKNNEKISLTFAVCTLIFVSPIAGVLLIVEENI